MEITLLAVGYSPQLRKLCVDMYAETANRTTAPTETVIPMSITRDVVTVLLKKYEDTTCHLPRCVKLTNWTGTQILKKCEGISTYYTGLENGTGLKCSMKWQCEVECAETLNRPAANTFHVMLLLSGSNAFTVGKSSLAHKVLKNDSLQECVMSMPGPHIFNTAIAIIPPRHVADEGACFQLTQLELFQFTRHVGDEGACFQLTQLELFQFTRHFGDEGTCFELMQLELSKFVYLASEELQSTYRSTSWYPQDVHGKCLCKNTFSNS